MSTANKACCTIPPAQSDYTPKGTFKSVGDYKRVYVTGKKSDKAIVCVYDIFGFYPQTQQGADIIAEAVGGTVYMPDFFEPSAPFPHDPFPPTNPKDLDDFFAGPANPPKAIAGLVKFGEILKKEGAKHVGAYGFCWGGKVTILAGGENSPFKGVSIIHPAMLSAEDAEKLTVPLAIFPSKDEPKDEFEKIVNIISKKSFAKSNDSKYYSNMFHGWAAARADLRNEENKKEYNDVYARIVEFFCKILV